MANVIVTGGKNGIGAALVKELAKAHNVVVIDVQSGSVATPNEERYKIADIRYSGQLIDVAYELKKENFDPDIVINCAGTNFIDWIENTADEAWDMVLDTNAKGIFNMTKAFMVPLILRKGTIVNIVSNASHIPMTNSIAYNASKGAAHIMTLQMARELGPKGITVFGISPNRCSDTKMSEYIDEKVCLLRGWTKKYAREYQLKALPAGEETDPEVLAEFIGFLLSDKKRHKYLAGTVIPYGK